MDVQFNNFFFIFIRDIIIAPHWRRRKINRENVRILFNLRVYPQVYV